MDDAEMPFFANLAPVEHIGYCDLYEMSSSVLRILDVTAIWNIVAAA
jgi:hypothetical protein